MEPCAFKANVVYILRERGKGGREGLGKGKKEKGGMWFQTGLVSQGHYSDQRAERTGLE